MQKATMARPSVAFDKVSVKPQQSFEDAIDNCQAVGNDADRGDSFTHSLEYGTKFRPIWALV